MSAQFTPGPWSVCQHLTTVENDAACRCGYRGVVFGPDPDIAFAICQPGHEPAPEGQEGTEPARYPREVEIANSHLIAAAPDLYEALEALMANDGARGNYDASKAFDAKQAAERALAKARDAA